MKGSPFDNLPSLTQEEAFKILETPIGKLDLSSDYYKAVFHLQKFPGPKTEEVLLSLVDSSSREHAVSLARRKAIEVLARLNCCKAITSIAKCLTSDDIYLVEISAWALQQLGCQDAKIHDYLGVLLDNPNQNRRVLVQTLSKLEVLSQLPRIKKLSKDQKISPSVRGASIAAISNLTGRKDQNKELLSNLLLPNQNLRHCAIQDVIDSGDISLIPLTLKTPVAPFFRTRLITELWPKGKLKLKDLSLIDCLDSIILDDPCNLNIVHKYDENPSLEFLVNELFGTDFSRIYLAIETLSRVSSEKIWPLLWNNWDRIRKDYGALYTLNILFRKIKGWKNFARDQIADLDLESLNSDWPKFMKFRPSAIITLLKLNPSRCITELDKWLDENSTPFWLSRYSTLLGLESVRDRVITNKLDIYFKTSLLDSHPFVREKVKSMMTNLRA